MDTSRRLRIARLLVLVQLVVASVSVLETLVVMSAGLGSPVVLLLTVGQVVLLALAARALGRGGRVRLAVAAQVVFLIAGGGDLLIAAATGMPPALLPVVMRVLVPVAVLVLLRRDRVRRRVPLGDVAVARAAMADR